MSDSGYEIAKDIEGFSSNEFYDIKWLNMMNSDFDDAGRENVKLWLKKSRSYK